MQEMLVNDTMKKKRKLKIPGLTFSWKRAIGVNKAKRKIAKLTRIPTTRTGRRNKIGRFFLVLNKLRK